MKVRLLAACGALILVASAAAAATPSSPVVQTAPDPCVFNDQMREWLVHNTPAGSRERNLDTDLSAFVADVQAFCQSTTTTTAPTTTTTAPTTTTTAPTTTTTTAPTTTTTTPPSGGFPDESTTGPVAGEETCDTTVNGDHEILTGGTAGALLVIDGLCVIDGSLVIDADYVRVQNSQVTSAPPGSPYPVFVDDGHHGIEVVDSILDCGPASTGTNVQAIGILAESGAKQSNPGLAGLYLDARRLEVRDCTDGFQLASNSYYSGNWIHRPDNTDDAHADGVQWSTEDDGVTGIHDTVFEHNAINFPDASSAFQYHNRFGGELTSEWPTRITVRYNLLEGGAAVVRFPGRGCPITECGGVDLAFYGNHVGRLTPNEFFLCDGDTASVAVWGVETGVASDRNVNLDEPGDPTLERAC